MPKSFPQTTILSANGLNNTNVFQCALDQSGPDNMINVSVAGTQSGLTLVAEGVMAGGSTTWIPLAIQDKGSGIVYNGSVVVPSNANRGYMVDCREMTQVRFWPSAGTFTSFTIEAYSLKDKIDPTIILVGAAQPAGFSLLSGSADVIPPNASQTYVVTSTGVDAMTLAAPTPTVNDGVKIRITSDTAHAHTITATGLLDTGGTAVNVATFAAHAGATIELMAYQGAWVVQFQNGVSFS